MVGRMVGINFSPLLSNICSKCGSLSFKSCDILCYCTAQNSGEASYSLKYSVSTNGYNKLAICLSIYRTSDLLISSGQTFLLNIFNNVIFMPSLVKIPLEGHTPGWKRICFVLEKSDSLMSVFVNTKYVHTEKMDEALFANNFKMSFKSQSALRLTLVDIYTVDEVKSDFLEAKFCESRGNIYAWNISDWDYNGQVNVKKEYLEDICNNTIKIKYPEMKPFNEAIENCQTFNGTIPFTSLKPDLSSSLVPYLQTDGLLQPLTFSNDCLLTNVYDNSSVQDLPMDGGCAGDGVVMCSSNECKVLDYSQPAPFICEIPSSTVVRVRGLCMKSGIETIFKPTSGSNRKIKKSYVMVMQESPLLVL